MMNQLFSRTSNPLAHCSDHRLPVLDWSNSFSNEGPRLNHNDIPRCVQQVPRHAQIAQVVQSRQVQPNRLNVRTSTNVQHTQTWKKVSHSPDYNQEPAARTVTSDMVMGVNELSVDHECCVCYELLKDDDKYCLECKGGICNQCKQRIFDQRRQKLPPARRVLVKAIQCPKCRSQQAFTRQLTKQHRDVLSKLRFKCSECNIKLDREDAFMHIPTCGGGHKSIQKIQTLTQQLKDEIEALTRQQKETQLELYQQHELVRTKNNVIQLRQRELQEKETKVKQLKSENRKLRHELSNGLFDCFTGGPMKRNFACFQQSQLDSQDESSEDIMPKRPRRLSGDFNLNANGPHQSSLYAVQLSPLGQTYTQHF